MWLVETFQDLQLVTAEREPSEGGFPGGKNVAGRQEALAPPAFLRLRLGLATPCLAAHNNKPLV